MNSFIFSESLALSCCLVSSALSLLTSPKVTATCILKVYSILTDYVIHMYMEEVDIIGK
jgi:hypothetical protein